jgi:hypothetical protein
MNVALLPVLCMLIPILHSKPEVTTVSIRRNIVIALCHFLFTSTTTWDRKLCESAKRKKGLLRPNESRINRGSVIYWSLNSVLKLGSSAVYTRSPGRQEDLTFTHHHDGHLLTRVVIKLLEFIHSKPIYLVHSFLSFLWRNEKMNLRTHVSL